MENNYIEIAKKVLKTIGNLIEGIEKGVDISLHKDSIIALYNAYFEKVPKETIIEIYLNQIMRDFKMINTNKQLKVQLGFFYRDLNLEIENLNKKVA